MKKNFFITSILIISVQVQIHSQENDFTDRLKNTGENISSALSSIVEWYDIPISIGYFSRNNFKNQIIINPSSFEKEFVRSLGIKGNSSPGSIDKNIIPNLIFHSRLFATTAINIFTDADISQDDYIRIFLFQKSLIYTYTVTEIVKHLVSRERPDKSDNKSFFSGHTSTTFAAATFLFLEMNNLYDEWNVTRRSDLLKFSFKAASFSALYGWASYVGYSRIRDEKHYLSDVLVGAAVGTLISIFVYDKYLCKDEGLLNHFNFFSNDRSFGLSVNMKF